MGAGGSSPADVYGDDEQLAGLTLSQTTSVYHQGPLPPAAEYAGYERAFPGSADRMLGMAERALAAGIERDLVPARAEARAFTFATISASLLPYAALLAGVVLVVSGYDGIGFVAVAVGLLATGPRLIAATRRALNLPTAEDSSAVDGDQSGAGSGDT